MKKILCHTLSVIFLLSCLVSCGKAGNDPTKTPSKQPPLTKSPVEDHTPPETKEPTIQPTEPIVPPDPPEPVAYPIYSSAVGKELIYQNTYYYINTTERTLYQRDLQNPEDTGRPLWQGEGEDPFTYAKYSDVLWIVDEGESQKKGSAVLIITQTNTKGCTIGTFDTATSTYTKLTDVNFGDLGTMEIMCMYGDSIYYIYLDMDTFEEPLYKVSKTTGEVHKLASGGMDVPPPILVGALGEKLYYYSYDGMDWTPTIFQCGLTLIGKKALCTVDSSLFSQSLTFITEDYIYYAQGGEKITVGSESVRPLQMVKVPMDNPKIKGQVVLDDISQKFDPIRRGNTIFYCKASEEAPNKHGNLDATTLYVFDMETGTEKALLTFDIITDSLSYSVLASSSDYIVYEITEQIRSDTMFSFTYTTKLLDINTLTERVLDTQTNTFDLT